MQTIVSLLQRIVALLTSLVMAVSPVTDTLEVLSLDAPVFVSADSEIMPLAVSSAFVGVSGTTVYAKNVNNYFGLDAQGKIQNTVPAYDIGIGTPVAIASGSTVEFSWSGFTLSRAYWSYIGNASCAYTSLQSVLWMGHPTVGSTMSSPVSMPVSASYSIRDQYNNILLSNVSLSGSYKFKADHDITLLSLVASCNSFIQLAQTRTQTWIDVSSASMGVTYSDPVNDAIFGIQVATADTALSNRAILQAIQDLNSTVGAPSAMEQLENNYLDKMENQLSQVENMMSPENPALPNGGDVAGFASDVQSGLGLSGSSFNASEFAEATSAFGGSSSTAAGGPWEFFTQEVADALSGDTASVGLADDDYIFAWLDEAQRRYGVWDSSSP